jgi:hypothetical protein
MNKKRYTKPEFQTSLMNYVDDWFNGNVAAAARHFGVTRASLWGYLNDDTMERMPPKKVLRKLGFNTKIYFYSNTGV